MANAAATGAFTSIVVGGGVAGLFLAARLAEALAGAGIGPGDAPVLVLEKGERPGRKLLVAGSGRCNLTNEGPIADFLPRYAGAGRFLRRALHSFTNEDLIAWFAGRGLACVSEQGGKVFPATRKASDVLRVLLDECASCGVRLLTSRRVGAARRLGEGFALDVGGAEGTGTRAFLLAITTGGSSWPVTGSEGDGYLLAAGFGHPLVPPRPALTSVAVAGFALAGLSGLSFEALPLSLWRGGRKVRDFRGDLLLTHEGLSGPAILDASRGIVAGDRIEIDFSGRGREALRAELAASLARSPRALVRSLIGELGLPRRLAERLCELAGIEAPTTASVLRRDRREALACLVSSFGVEVASLGGWDRAMVTAGGVETTEVDPRTMESRLVPGLYFAGEVLDVDGDTGGFNLQAAFSTAAAAAAAMAAAVSGALAAAPARAAPAATGPAIGSDAPGFAGGGVPEYYSASKGDTDA